jgi:hypothetical protein
MVGIMYSAAGEPYVAEALAAARTSLRYNRVPHVLFASPLPSTTGEEEEALSIEPFESSANPYVDKIANMRRSPFERTIFLDSDTCVVGEIAHVLQLLDRYDVAAALSPGKRVWADPEVPFAFYGFNTGVVAWRANEQATEFLAGWEETYRTWLREEPFEGAGVTRGTADQAAFRRCVWTHGTRIAVLGPEYNYRTMWPGAVVGFVRVIHGRHDDFEQVAAQLNENKGPRTFPALGRTGEKLA